MQEYEKLLTHTVFLPPVPDPCLAHGLGRVNTNWTSEGFDNQREVEEAEEDEIEFVEPGKDATKAFEPAEQSLNFGLCRSELAGLKWSDFDWLNQEVLVQRSVIANRVDAVKTKRSKARLPLDPALIEVLQNWRSLSDFKAKEDRVWASPWVAGAMPLYTNAIQSVTT